MLIHGCERRNFVKKVISYD